MPTGPIDKINSIETRVVALEEGGGGGAGGAWSDSGYTLTANKLAGSDGSGGAIEISVSSPLQIIAGTLSILSASGSQTGLLTSTDWTTFNNKVGSSRQISTTAPLSGGGDLSSNRTLTIGYASPITLSGSNLTVQDGNTSQKGVVQLASSGSATAGRAVEATDSRLSDSRAPSGSAGGDLTGTYPNPTVNTINGVAVATVTGQRTAHETTYDHTLLPSSGEKNALAGTSGTPGTTNKYVTSDDSRLLGLGGAGGVMAVTELGHGGNGNYDFDGVNTYTAITYAASVYSVDQTMIIRANNLTVRTGITLKLNGSPLHVLGTLTLEGTAIIENNGGDASGTTLGEGASPNLIPTTTTGNVYFGGLDGQAGRAGTASGGGNAQTSSTIVICGGSGGSGGRGSYSGTDAAGGTTYTGTVPSLYEHYHGELLMLLANGRADVATARYYLCGGMGGGAGGNRIGSGSGTLNSGAGGGGGGITAIWCSVLNASTSATIRANGGAGSAASYTSPGGNAGSGGGAGGGGGVLLFKAARVTSVGMPIFECKGGAGGNAQSVGTGFGDGGNGGNGGKCIVIVGNYTGSAPTQTVTGGAGGTGSGTGNANGATGSSGMALYKAL